MEEGKRYLWALTEKTGDDELIGLIELCLDGPFNRGFWLIPEHHRKGYMTEAVAAVNDFAFETVGVETLRLGNAEPNVGSHQLKAKSGATLVEYVSDVLFIGGTFREEVWELTADQWRQNRIRFLTGQ
jgi:RimJ/RimL family protein N-acetyltransferase